MASVNLREYIFGLVLVGSVLTGLLAFSGGMFDAYGVDHDQSELQGAAEGISSNVSRSLTSGKNATSEIGGGSAIAAGGFFLNSVWRVFKTMINTVVWTPSAINDIARILPVPIPDWFIGIPIALVLIIIIFNAISAYRGFEI